MTNLNKTIKKLQLGIKFKHGVVLTLARNEWYSPKMDMIINDYIVKQLVKNEETGRSNYVEIFKSTSKIQQCLFSTGSKVKKFLQITRCGMKSAGIFMTMRCTKN